MTLKYFNVPLQDIDLSPWEYSDDFVTVHGLPEDDLSSGFYIARGEDNNLEFIINPAREYSDDYFTVDQGHDPGSFDHWLFSQSVQPAAEEINFLEEDAALLEEIFSFLFLSENDLNGVENNNEKNVVDEVSGILGNEEKAMEDEEDDDDDSDYDLDDELVPKYVSKKLGRERMRKLGKRGFSKINNSKRSPFSQIKPGCVHGKHGLGMKFI